QVDRDRRHAARTLAAPSHLRPRGRNAAATPDHPAAWAGPLEGGPRRRSGSTDCGPRAVACPGRNAAGDNEREAARAPQHAVARPDAGAPADAPPDDSDNAPERRAGDASGG